MDKLRANKGHRRNGLRHGAFAPAAGFLALAMATSPELCAEERKMTAIQIFEALAGNTVVGAWGRKPYRAYFRPDGLTIYVPDGGEPESGKWRVDEDKDQYCAWWARSGWRCYHLYRDGRAVIWENPYDSERSVSRILPGKNLSATLE